MSTEARVQEAAEQAEELGEQERLAEAPQATGGSARAFPVNGDASEGQTQESAPDVESSLIVVIYQCGRGAALRRSVIDGLIEDLNNFEGRRPIELWLDSPGGDAHAVYKLAVALRAKCSELRVVIPDYAKSGATLLALAADEILMAPTAELGPIDTQVPDPDSEHDLVSALDVAQALDFIIERAVDITCLKGSELWRLTRVQRMEAIQATLHFTAELLAPSVAKLDVRQCFAARRALEVASDYALRLLQRYHLRGTDPRTAPDPMSIVDRLVNGYSTHGFVIDRQEAGDIGLCIEHAEDYDLWDAAEGMWRHYRDAMEDCVTVCRRSTLASITAEAPGEEDESENQDCSDEA